MTGDGQLTRHNNFSRGDATSRGCSSFCRGDLARLQQLFLFAASRLLPDSRAPWSLTQRNVTKGEQTKQKAELQKPAHSNQSSPPQG